MASTIDAVEQHFDHHAPDYVKTMRSRSSDMRQHCPVIHSGAYGGFWVLSRHQDITRAFHDHGGLSSAPPGGITIPPLGFGVPTVTESDEPLHSHYRRALWPFLTPAAVAGYEKLVRDNVTELINGFIETGKADIMDQLAKPVPAMVTGQFFGFTAEGGRHLFELFETLTKASARGEQAAAAAGELFEIVQGSLDVARVSPGDNVSSAIVSYEYDGKTFTNDECLGVLLTAIGGAIETTVSAIGFAVYLLWQYPEQRRKLIECPELAVSAVEEVLRMESPVNASARTLTKSCEVEGVTLPAGDRVLLLVDSANYDSAVFEDPQQFKVNRPNNPHLTFGHGIHKCEGQHLARLELRVVIEELVRRIPKYEVVGTPVIEKGQVYMPTDLHISFPPGHDVSVS